MATKKKAKKKENCKTTRVKGATVEVCVLTGRRAAAAGKAFDAAMAKARKSKGSIVGSF
jgi:hypothetical protein